MFKPVLAVALMWSIGTAVAQTPPPQPNAGAGVRVGVLTCNVSRGVGLVFGSTRSIACTYAPNTGTPEQYTGRIERYGVDVGFTRASVLLWGVVAPTAAIAPGSLAGNYGGVSAGATFGVGLGANVLVGGSNNTIALQPLSIEGNQGLNLALGIAGLRLERVTPRRR